MKGRQIDDAQIMAVNGGVDLYPDSKGSKSGTLGPCGSDSHPYKYKDELAVNHYINAHLGDKAWHDGAEIDAYMIDGMLKAGIITE